MDLTGLPQRLQARLARGRAMAESRMRDTCRITRPGTGQGPFNQDTGQYDAPPPVVVYEGKCYIPQRASVSASTANGGEASWEVGQYPLSLPVAGDGYAPGEEIAAGMEVTYLTAADDPSLAGRVFGIVAPARQSQATARRFVMKEVVGS